MTIVIRFLGLELLHVWLSTDDAVEAEADGSGTTGSTPVGFVAAFEVPDLIPLPNRNNGWGDEGNRL